MKELKYIEKPFEWAYEGLAPLLLRDVLETKKGFSFSLAILFSCIARRLGICLTPVPVSQIGKFLHLGIYANLYSVMGFACIPGSATVVVNMVSEILDADTGMGQSIAGPDLSRWLLRHDGACSLWFSALVGVFQTCTSTRNAGLNAACMQVW